jgi:hypothetical protein
VEVCEKLDFGRLLGFDTLSGSKSGNVDFQDETVSAKLGAKRGEEGAGPSGGSETRSGLGTVSAR